MYREPITIALVCLIGLIGYGCGNDTPEPNELPARLIDSEPANGEHIVMGHYHAKIKLFFDRKPQMVTILRQPAKITGTKAVWFGSIRELVVPNTTLIMLPIEWGNPDGTRGEGAKILLYLKVNNGIGPIIVDSNFYDGEESHKNLDPDVLNRDGIVLVFNEMVAHSSLLLTHKDETVLAWKQTIDDKTVILDRKQAIEDEHGGILVHFNGEALQINKTYIIIGQVSDEFDNRSSVRIVFTTKPADDEGN